MFGKKKDMSVSVLQLGDLVYSYPSQDDPNIQTLTTAKREFLELASKVTEPVPPRGELYPHQELFRRYLLEYDRHLLFHRTGTGKTCTMFGGAEQFKKGMMSGAVDFIQNYIIPQRTNIKRIYILTRGPALVEELRRQLVCVCTAGDYLTDLVRGSREESQRKRNITAALDPYYSILTYSTFVNDIVNRGLNEEQIRDALNDTAIFIDEVQNLRPDPTLGSEDEQRRNYQTLWNIFHLIERSKVILASATPMVDNVNEMAPVMNLILPSNQQLDITRDYTGATLEELEPYFRGKISYVRELDTGAQPVYRENIPISLGVYQIGNVEVESQSVVYATVMSEFQEQAYDIVAGSQDAFRAAERKAANFVYPDGRSNREAFNDYVTRIAPDQYQANPELAEFLTDLDNMGRLSSKFSETVRLVRDEPGNAFAYCDFKGNGGAVVLGLCFQYSGFEQFLESSSVFVSNVESGSSLRPYCSSGASGERRLRISPRIPGSNTQPFRFALLTSDTPPNRVAAILELFNSPENAHGEYLKVLIGSPISKIGLNLANVLQMHLVGPSWNQSNIYQAISRALRTTSHVVLIAEERERLASLGLDPDGARVQVNIYQHASITDNLNSVDIEMYQGAERKDIGIRRMERMMKQASYDCQIHYNRNVRPTDVDGSAICDYDICAYQCVSPTPERLMEDSFSILYSDRTVNRVIEQLREILSTRLSVSLPQIEQILESPQQIVADGIRVDEIQQLVRGVPKRYILFAISRMINERIPVVDRYGSAAYVQEDGQTIFLQRDFPLIGTLDPDRGASYYTEVLHGIHQVNIGDYVASIQGPEQERLLQQLRNLDPTDPQFDIILNQLNLESRVNLLEETLFETFSGRGNEWYDAVGERFRSYWYVFNEPVEAIQRTTQILANRGRGRGRKPNPNTQARVRRIRTSQVEEGVDLDIVPEGTGEQVAVHNLYNQSFDRVSYAVTARFSKAEGRIRLLKPSEGSTFRDANPYELIVYNEMIQRELAARTADFEQFDIYGTLLQPDNKFRIRDKTTEDTEEAERDARKKNRGKDCNTWKKPELIELLYKLNLPPPNARPVTMSREEMILFLQKKKAETTRVRIANMDDDLMRFFVQWYQSGYPKENYICPYLQNYLAGNGMLMVV